MPKENRFAGLGEAIDGNEDEDEDEAESEQKADQTANQDAEPVDETEKDSTETPEEPEGESSPETPEEETPEANAVDENQSTDGADQSADSEPEPSAESSQHDDDEPDGPAFEFEATTAKSVYVRQETLDVMDDAEFEVESLLRREHDIRDLTGREFHDALIRVAAEYPEEIVDVVLDTRDS
ncbi:hypothetical protein C453_12556 [Haloferax elongans ATCC BAA-1513]|uniref:Uncharacterized protein n=1 Tax=Haloferax elongans ATCC BAA-1513 TaxID=1230453 RepID=M0HM25_HALEO|nr:hypothetical protein [Haloferax elongans]ELZ84848.1 hypothetical protein C453_12556 [Haloferax elongans ATCC BAA-1513]